MKELVFRSEKGNPVTTSLLVAEKFEKEHKHVLDAIRNLVAENSAASSLFFESQYENRGKYYPMFIMSRDGFSLLVMGFTGKQALQFKLDFIDAFNKMEQVIKTGGFQIPTTFKEALLLAAEQQDVIEAQGRLLEAQKPAVTFMNAVTGTTTNILMRDMAKLLSQNGVDIGEIRLYDWMVKNKYLIRSQRWSKKKQRYENDYMPTQIAANLKVFFVTEQAITVGESSFIKHTVKVTGKGQIYFVKKFLENEKYNS